MKGKNGKRCAEKMDRRINGGEGKKMDKWKKPNDRIDGWMDIQHKDHSKISLPFQNYHTGLKIMDRGLLDMVINQISLSSVISQDD